MRSDGKQRPRTHGSIRHVLQGYANPGNSPQARTTVGWLPSPGLTLFLEDPYPAQIDDVT